MLTIFDVLGWDEPTRKQARVLLDFIRWFKPSDGCWEWEGYQDLRGGYGQYNERDQRKGFGQYSRNTKAHRLMYEFAFGPVPTGMLVLHRCDNPPCVRPDHLFAGTRSDNTQDMIAKDRARFHGKSLSAAERAEIISRVRNGETQRSIAKEFGLHHQTVNNLIRGRTWKGVITPTDG